MPDYKKISYIGNAAYCYANCTAMLLSSKGENVSPSFIEVLTGVGLSAEKKRNAFLFFNHPNLPPDLGITKALDILGFDYKVNVSTNKLDFPYKELKNHLDKNPAILGPLDMGYLTYNPRHKFLFGADHYILAYKIDEKNIYLHDPAGFPHVFLPLEKLKISWQAEKISYKQGFYRYITLGKRIKTPSENEIYHSVLQHFKSIYQEKKKLESRKDLLVGPKAILDTADRITNGEISKKEIEHFIYFALPLGAKRAQDFATFFKARNQKLATLKKQQAEIFGIAHTFAVAKDFLSLASSLKKIAEIEKKIEDEIINL